MSAQSIETRSRKRKRSHEYVYNPLPSRLTQPVRLLHLEGDLSAAGNLKGELHVYDLESAPEYRAVSYVWGDPQTVGKIETSKGHIGINHNLADALEGFRKASGSLILWADACYINQSDPTEKVTQVTQMRDVFRNAKEVLGYLGPVTEQDADTIFDLVTVFDSEYENRGISYTKVRTGTLQLPPASHPGWKSFCRNFQYWEWFRR